MDAVNSKPGRKLPEALAPFAGLFHHSLLQLMPFGDYAPPHMLELQTHVESALDQNLPRVTRVMSAWQASQCLQRPRPRIPDSRALLKELLGYLGDLKSPLIWELIAKARLEDEGVQVLWPWTLENGGSGVPVLVREDSPWTTAMADPAKYQSGVATLTQAVLDLQGLPDRDLQQLLVEELQAAIRCLQIHSLYLAGVSRRPRAQDLPCQRLAAFQGAGLGLWTELLRHLRAKPPTDSTSEFLEYFGDRAQRQTLLQLLGQVESVGLTAGSSVSDSLPAATGTTKPQLTVVRNRIPAANSEDDKTTLMRYECLREPLPIATLPEPQDIKQLVEGLHSEFPWATDAVDALAEDMLARRIFGCVEMGSPPTLLVGLPGCGKSRLVRRISEELCVPYLPISLAGMSDSMSILGTSRGWASGQPSPLVTLLADRRSASALVLLDEVDKALGQTIKSVSPTAALLNLLEPEGAARWYDGFLQVLCDLSRVMFWATANTLGLIPKPLLSRFRIVVIPEPRREDFTSIANCVVADLEKSWRLPAGTLPAVDLERSALQPRTAREVRLVVQKLIAQSATVLSRPHHRH